MIMLKHDDCGLDWSCYFGGKRTFFEETTGIALDSKDNVALLIDLYSVGKLQNMCPVP